MRNTDKMQVKKVLYISYDGMTDPLGQSQVLPYLVKLAAYSYQITLLSCEKPQRFAEGKTAIEQIAASSGITWRPICYTKNPPIFSTLYDYYRLKKLAVTLNEEENYQIVHCRSYLPSLIGLHLKRKYQVKFIFDMRGFWADERVDGGLWNLGNPLYNKIYKFFKKQEKLFLENADFTVSLTEKGKQEILTWHHVNVKPERIRVIPCCVDTALFDPNTVSDEQRKLLRKQLGIDEQTPILSYLGSIGTWYLLEDMLAFFVQLKQQIPSAKFLFVTLHNEADILKRAELKGILQSDIIIRPAERKKVPAMLSLSNWSIFFIKPSYSKMSSSPTKQGEIMAMDIPVICNTGVGDTDFIVDKYNSGVAVNDFNFSEAITALRLFNHSQGEIRKGAVDYFSLEKGVQQYKNIYESICK